MLNNMQRAAALNIGSGGSINVSLQRNQILLAAGSSDTSERIALLHEAIAKDIAASVIVQQSHSATQNT